MSNHEESIRKFLQWLAQNRRYSDTVWYEVFALVNEYYNSLNGSKTNEEK